MNLPYPLALCLSLAFALNALAATSANAIVADEPHKRPIVSLDLCTDYLISWLNPTGPVVYSNRIIEQRPSWLKDKVIKTHSGSLEQLIKLRGNLYITGEFNNRLLKQRLTDLGRAVTTTQLPRNLNEATTQAKKLAKVLSSTTEFGVTTSLDNSLPPYSPTAPTAPTAMLLGANGFVTGKNTFEHDLLTRAGFKNWAPFGGYRQFTVEGLATNMPPVIIESYSNRPALANRIAFHSALRNQANTTFLRSSHPKLWQCHGPWSTTLVKELRSWLIQN